MNNISNFTPKNINTESIIQNFNPIGFEIERKFLEERKIFLWGQVNDESAPNYS